MPEIDFLSALERECATMQQNLVEADLSAPVLTCPGWAIRDLVVHTGFVHRHKTAAVRDGYADLMPGNPGDPGDDLVEWFSEGVAEMLDVFENADLSVPTWTWCDHDHVAAWWVRRMAHETLIHGVDLALAVGVSPKVDELLAQDGISEVLDEYILGAPKWAHPTVGGGIVALISPRETWVVTQTEWSGTSPNSKKAYRDEVGLEYADSGARPGVSLEASAVDIDLWLWGRLDSRPGTVVGDESLLDYVRSVALVATQ